MTPFDRFAILLAILLIAIPVSLHFYSVNQYHKYWDETKVIDLTPEDVVKRFGKPSFGTAISNVWVYQKTEEPDAFVTFKDCRVERVIKLLYSDEQVPSVEVTNKKNFHECFASKQSFDTLIGPPKKGHMPFSFPKKEEKTP